MNKKGFTLVELMVVVAIIGVLTFIAIPQYNKLKSKTLTSEAKIALSAIYQSEIAFQQEANTYATCLSSMGFAPGEGRYYATGFSGDALTDMPAYGCNSFGTDSGVGHQFDAQKSAGTYIAVGSGLDASCSSDGNTFKACALGTISKDAAFQNAATADYWSINEVKNVIHHRLGY